MNIAYIATSKIPSREANSIHVMKMCSALAAKGNSVTLIVPGDAETEPDVQDVFEHYGVPDNFAIKRVAPVFPRLSPGKYIRRSYYMARCAVKGDFDCIYSRDISVCLWVACVFRRYISFECHSSFKPNSVSAEMFRLLINSEYFVKLIVITNALKQHYTSQFPIDKNRVYVAPDGADVPPDDISPVQLAERSKDKYHVGYIGHLYKGRGIELIGEIARSCPFAFFHIVGGNEDDIKLWKERYTDIENICFYGYVPPPQTVCFGKSMDVLIAPYQNDLVTAMGDNTVRWMSPLKIFEYMALGKPVIASDMQALREVLTDRVNGILCPADDVTAWCMAITELYENDKLAQQVAGNALAESSKYTWAARAENLTENVFAEYSRRQPENTRYTLHKTGMVCYFRLLKFVYLSHFGRKIHKNIAKILPWPALPRRDAGLFAVNPDIVKDYKFFGLPGKHVFFGYYDIPQISPDGTRMLAHIADKNAEPGIDLADVGYFDLSDGEYHRLGSTPAWCWQQGSRLRWHPLESDKVLYNDLDGDSYVTKAVDIHSKETGIAAPALYDLSNDFRYGVSVNFARLQRLRPGYGYSVFPDKTADTPAPDDDGIFLVDLKTRSAGLIISLRELSQGNNKDLIAEQYINHVSFSPGGRRFIFYNVAKHAAAGFNRNIELYLYDTDTAELKLIESDWITSHYAWRSDNELLTISANGETMVYCIYDLTTGNRRIIENAALMMDGHPSFFGSKNRFVYDTCRPYMDEYLKLFLFDIEQNDAVFLSQFYNMPVKSNDARCDLHPRVWEKDGKQIVTLDTMCTDGVRKVFMGTLSTQPVAQKALP